jgi:hypothetical protein
MLKSRPRFRLQPGRTGPCAPALLLAGALLAGCAAQTAELSAGGFAAGDGGRLSLAVAQSRAQFPELSAQGLAYAMRESKAGGGAPELALRGTGVGFSRGLQLKERGKGSIQLYLDKATYARGYAVVQLEGGAEEKWPIVAYELRGKAGERFEFSYLLAPPGGGLRYLVLLGGNYTDAGKEVLAYEGTLFIPAAGKPVDEWARAFKFDFGYKYPARAAYLAGVDEAESLFRELQRDVPAIQSLSERAAKTENDAASARQTGDGATARRGPDPAALAARAGDLKAQLAQKIGETEAKALHYYEVRTAADNAYAAFVLTNPYTWRNIAGQADAYKRWQKVEFHHPAIDKLVETLVTFLPDPKRLESARSQAMALFAKNNNWDKNPEAQETPPAQTPSKAEKPSGM